VTQAETIRVIYDETLDQRLRPVRDAVARCGADLLKVLKPGPHKDAVVKLLADVREHGEQAVFDELRGKLTS
jgi:hypothetical protein